jgi:hypothetical protein
MDNIENECLCINPILQKDTKQCGKCKLYIDRVKHILLTQNSQPSQIKDKALECLDIINKNKKK